MQSLLIAATCVTAACAAYSDLKQRRIFNWLTFGSAGMALAVRFATSGSSALLAGAEGWLLGIGLLLVPFALGWLGGGDVKLLAAFGALGGPMFVQQTAIYGCLLGGIAAIFWLVWQRKLWFTIRYFAILIRHPAAALADHRAALPFGAVLSIGAVAGMALAGGLA